MAISNFPLALQPIIQQGFLEREFHDGLTSALGFRDVADRESVAINVGETVTKTRAGLKAPVTTPLSPSSNTNFDNGLTPTPFTVEQYTLGIDMYGDTIDLNVVTSQVGLANQFVQNAKTNGVQGRQSLDRLARNALFNAYMGGNTRVRTTLGAPAATVAVDDVRGFENVIANGKMVPVSGTNTAQVTVGASVYTLVGTARDGTNVSATAFTGGGAAGVSGTLTFSANVTVADGTAGNAVVHANAAPILRPNSRSTWGSLVAGDKLSAQIIVDAVARLRNNTGMGSRVFDLYLDNVSMSQLFGDPDFKLAYQGQYGSREFRQGEVFQLYGAKFITTTEAPVQASGGLTVHRPILCAPGALVEGDFAGMERKAAEISGVSIIDHVDGVCQITRGPMDRLAQIVAQSWFWIGGFVAPTDVTTNQNIIPTAQPAYLKRAIVIEHV